MRLRLASLAVMLAAHVVAHADTVGLTLSSPTQTGAAGSTLAYTATVSAPASNTAAEYLNGDSYSFPVGSELDDTGFFNTFPLSLDPGQSYTGTLFTFTLPTSALPGTLYGGNFSILGGSSDNATDTLATVAYAADVPAAAATPEPPSILLLGTGVLGLAFFFRRHFTAAA